MLLKKIRGLLNRISYRLALYYCLFFIPCFLFAFGVLFYLTSNFLENRDRDLLSLQAMEIQDGFEKNEIEGIKSIVTKLKDRVQIQKVLIRLMDQNNHPIFSHLPENTPKFDVKKLDEEVKKHISNQFNSKWHIVSLNDGEESVYEFKVYELKNGYHLIIGANTDDRDDLLENFRDIFLLILFPVLLICSWGAILIAQKMLLPIKNITASIGEVSAGKLSSRVPEPIIHDELYELSIIYNQMGNHIEKLIQTLNETVDNIAHDLKTPISRSRIAAELALKSGTLEDLKYAAENNIEGCDSILSMIHAILLMARYDAKTLTLNKIEFKTREMIDEIVNLYQFVAEEKNIKVNIESDESLIFADRSIMKQCLANLIDNAIKYSPINTTVTIKSYSDHFKHIIIVKDQGIGISTDDSQKIWERLYRAEKSRNENGMGLGLSLVKTFVSAHEGKISVKSELGVGSEFTIEI